MTRDPAFEEWIEEARRVPVLQVAMALRGGGHLSPRRCRNVPCPACGGVDRFSINMNKGIFFCRKSGAAGDAIALVQHADGCDFLAAVETVTGRPPPGRDVGPAEREARRQRAEALARERQQEAERRSQAENDFRAREIQRAHEIWKAGKPLPGSAAEAYLARRGLSAAPGAKLRSLDGAKYWHNVRGAWRVLHEGPAMVGAIQGRDGRFCGCHITYIDLSTPKGKAQIHHPETGEILDAKKMRGSAKGGYIRLGGEGRCRRLILGEGIETVYSVRQAMCDLGRDLGNTWFWSAMSLNNIGGRATAMITHPTLTTVDARGRKRAVRVAGPEPVADDSGCVMPPAEAEDIVLLGDGDSDRLTTENSLRRFARRWAASGRTIRAAWARAGADFGDMWTEAAA